MLCLFKFEVKTDGHAKRTITLFTDVIKTKFEKTHEKALKTFSESVLVFSLTSKLAKP